MKRFSTLLLIILMSAGSMLRADEGMWLLPLLEKLNIGKMTEMGLKLSAQDIYSLNQACLKDAIVSIPGCTGEIVSQQGLLLTNHHCGYSSIQEHSSVEHDYLTDGFWAKTLADELPNPGMFANFLLRIEDVTDKMLAGLSPAMTEDERNAAINSTRAVIEKEAANAPGIRATVSNYYSGNTYYLLVYERYTDVRLVGAPPQSIGKYGNDTDNWEWPRHTGDFSVFRVYAGPDGRPAPYSKDNVPLKAKYWLPVSIKDLNKDDFAMVLGYPGRTQRYYTSYEINEIMKITNPIRIKVRGLKQENWMSDMVNNQKINIQYSDKFSTSSNYWKYSIGQNLQLEKNKVIAKKQETENQFITWVNADAARKAKYGEALNMIRTAIEGRAESQYALNYINETSQGCELFGFDQVGSVLMPALSTNDKQKIDDAVALIRDNLTELYKDYNAPTDQKTMKAMLKNFRSEVPARYHPDFYVNVVDKKFRGNIDKFVDDMFARSIFTSETKLAAFLDKPVLKTIQNDPAILTFTSLRKVYSEVAGNSGKYDAQLSSGRRLWMAALQEMIPEKTQYPDANSTMRLSYGSIKDYDPKDGVTYKCFTTLQGVVDKYKPGDYEFDLPQRLIDLNKKKEFGRYASSRGYMPVCFLTTNDITGGNSGSPVLNANGELIGLAFDGNWEAMSGDVAFEPSLQRCIVVDIRYVLWIMDIYAGARHLVDEMTIRQ